MKVAFITPSFPLADDSCSGVFVERLAFYVGSKADVTIITPSAVQPCQILTPKPYTVKAFRYAPWEWQLIAHLPGGIPVAFRENKKLVLLLPLFLISLINATVRVAMKSDLIHANWAITGAIAGIIGKLTGTPVITTLRGSDVSRCEKSWIDRQTIKVCLKTNKKIIAVCPPLANRVKQNFPWAEKKVVTITNGVDDSFQIVEKHNADNTMFRVISVGSLIPRKSMDTIIRAVASLSDTFDICLQIIGDGYEYDKLRRLGDNLGMGENLLMTGTIPSIEVPDYLAHADVFVLASRSEGRPNVVIEALAVGVPVVATDIEGVVDIINHEQNGLIFQPGDHQALAGAIKRLLRDSALRNKIAREGKNFISNNKLSWESCAEQYLNIYNDVTIKVS